MKLLETEPPKRLMAPFMVLKQVLTEITWLCAYCKESFRKNVFITVFKEEERYFLRNIPQGKIESFMNW